MKTRILAFVLMIAMILPVMGMTLAFADEAPVWTANGANVTEAEDGYYNVTGGEWDKSAYKTEKVQLEGLTVYLKVSDLSQAVGIILSGMPGARYADGSGVAMTLWQNPFGNGQSRFFVGSNHDYNGETYAHTDPASTNINSNISRIFKHLSITGLGKIRIIIYLISRITSHINCDNIFIFKDTKISIITKF